MSSDIKNMTDKCKSSKERNVNKEEQIKPARAVPMQHVAADLHSWEKVDHLILTDTNSGYVVSKKLNNKTTAEVTKQLKNWFTY